MFWSAEPLAFREPDLAALAERHDRDSRPSFVRLYDDSSDNRHADALEGRAADVRSALAGEDGPLARFAEASAAAHERLREVVAIDGTPGVVVFAGPEGWVEVFTLAEPHHQTAITSTASFAF